MRDQNRCLPATNPVFRAANPKTDSLQTGFAAGAAANQESFHTLLARSGLTLDELIQKVYHSELKKKSELKDARGKVIRELARMLRPIAAEDFAYLTEEFSMKKSAIYDALIKYGEVKDFDSAIFYFATYYLRNPDGVPQEILKKINEYFASQRFYY